MSKIAFVLTIIIIFAIISFLFFKISSQREQLDSILEWQNTELDKATVLERRKIEFEGEIERLDKQISTLRQILPQSLNLERFNEVLQNKLSNDRFVILSSRYSKEKSDLIEIGRITVVVEGDIAKIERTLDEGFIDRRLVKFSTLRSRGDAVEFDAEVYAADEPQDPSEEVDCMQMVKQKTKLLIPFPSLLNKREQALQGCSDLERYSKALEMVHELEGKRTLMVKMNSRIESLRSADTNALK